MVEVGPALVIDAKEMVELFDVRKVVAEMKDFVDVKWRYRALMEGLRMQRARVRTMYKERIAKFYRSTYLYPMERNLGVITCGRSFPWRGRRGPGPQNNIAAKRCHAEAD